MYSKEQIEEIKRDYGSYNAWQTIVNMRNLHPRSENRHMCDLAQQDLLDMQSKIKELEAKVAKLKMFEWAVSSECEFIELYRPGLGEIRTYLDDEDMKRLETYYANYKKNTEGEQNV